MNQTSRLKMIARPHPQFTIQEQCALLKVPRSTLYYKLEPVSDEELKLMRRKDKAQKTFQTLLNFRDGLLGRTV